MLPTIAGLQQFTMKPIMVEVIITLDQVTKMPLLCMVYQIVLLRRIREVRLAPPKLGGKDKFLREMASGDTRPERSNLSKDQS